MSKGSNSVGKYRFIINHLKVLSENKIEEGLDRITASQNIANFYTTFFQAMELTKKNILLIGPPGSGKGTYARLLSPILMIPTFGAGDYLKSEIQKGSDLGNECKKFVDNGQLVPDSVMTPMIINTLKQPLYKNGVLLDGYPRTMDQVSSLENSMEVDMVLQLYLPHSVLIQKMTGRKVCEKCGRSYNMCDIRDGDMILPPILPSSPNTCDSCHSSLITRSDDCVEVITKRLKDYYNISYPIVQHFNDLGLLRKFNIKKGISDLPDILKCIAVHFLKLNQYMHE